MFEPGIPINVIIISYFIGYFIFTRAFIFDNSWSALEAQPEKLLGSDFNN